jgi:hypothetical protein
MQPTPWGELYSAGLLAFKKFGHIDPISNIDYRYALFIDYDRKQLPKRLTIPKIHSAFRAMGFSGGYRAIRYSRTHRGWHIAIMLRKPVSATQRVAMEAIIGDDPMRAAMNFARARNIHRMPLFWKQRWNIFYDYKIALPSHPPGSQGGHGIPRHHDATPTPTGK